MSLHIANCPKCGKVFNPTFADVCPQCHKQIDREYEQCATYMREHRGATISELSEATGVSMRQITNFIRERRISITDSPNMGYPRSEERRVGKERRYQGGPEVDRGTFVVGRKGRVGAA